jgi:hypothetical protein
MNINWSEFWVGMLAIFAFILTCFLFGLAFYIAFCPIVLFLKILYIVCLILLIGFIIYITLN